MEVLVLERFSKLKKIDFGTKPKLRTLILKNLPELSNIRSNGDENAKIEILKLEELPKLRLTFYKDKNDNMPYHLSLFKFMALKHIKCKTREISISGVRAKS